MAPGQPDWGFMGAQGYYQGIANQQAQQASLQNYGNHFQNVSGGLAGMAIGGTSLLNQLGMQAYYAPSGEVTVQSLFAKAPEVKKKAKRLIERLRAEIEEWHGDILMRESYA